MSYQLHLLPEIDRAATKERVEKALHTARFYRIYGSFRREMNVTPAYSPRYHGTTNVVGRPAEDVAVANADHDEMMNDLTERVERAVQRLRNKESAIIQRTYLDDDLASELEMLEKLHVSRATYYRIQGRAIYNLAFMLRLEVYVDGRPWSKPTPGVTEAKS